MFMLSYVCVIIVPECCGYDIVLTPRLRGDSLSKNTLASLTSSFKFGLGGKTASSTVSPILCPSLVTSASFVVDLFPIMMAASSNRLATACKSCVTGRRGGSV